MPQACILAIVLRSWSDTVLYYYVLKIAKMREVLDCLQRVRDANGESLPITLRFEIRVGSLATHTRTLLVGSFLTLTLRISIDGRIFSSASDYVYAR